MRNERTHIRNIQTIWREVENITLDELSKQSGLSIGQLRKWESGKGMIKTSHEKVHFPISRIRIKKMKKAKKKLCQCPNSGFLLFYKCSNLYRR